MWLVMTGVDRAHAAVSGEPFKQRYVLAEERNFGGGVRIALFRPRGGGGSGRRYLY